MPVRVVESSAPSQVSGPNFRHTSPPASTLLSVGQSFSGTQNVSSLQKDEAWRVNVRIQGCDLDKGYLCGTMEALNVPMADTPRWKEQYFVNVGTDCGLTIAGFYYVCFSCADGSIHGFYYDPNSSPFQKLELKPADEGRSGFSFSSYELHPTTTITPTAATSTPFGNVGTCSLSVSFNSLTKQDCEEALATWRDKEATYMPHPCYLDYLHRSTTLLFARTTATHCLLKSCSRLNLSAPTLFSASNYLDRFMSIHRGLKWETWMVELVTMACLSVAAKFNETCSTAPSWDDFQMDYCFQSNTIHQMEILLLQSLQWRLSSTTCHSYAELLVINITNSLSLKPQLQHQLSATTTRFLVGSLQDWKYQEYRPSSVAICAVWCSLEELASLNQDYCDLNGIIPTLLKQSIDKDDVLRCREDMMMMVVVDWCSSPGSPVTVLSRDDDDSQVDISVFYGKKDSGCKLRNNKIKKKRKREDK
ncbi:Putative cyclin-D7-1 [Linum grandiflorum]